MGFGTHGRTWAQSDLLEIVILSACDTASSRSAYSPPLSGLASAFLAAGSEKVLACHGQLKCGH